MHYLQVGQIFIGAPGDAPPNGSFITKALGNIAFHFAVAANHPLAQLAEPIQNADILRYRSISAADSSRNLPPRASGILSGQDVLTVPDMQAKLKAHIAGLGVGYLPQKMSERHIASGELVIKIVAEPKPEVTSYIAWRGKGGKAQQWLINQLRKMSIDSLLA